MRAAIKRAGVVSVDDTTMRALRKQGYEGFLSLFMSVLCPILEYESLFLAFVEVQ